MRSLLKRLINEQLGQDLVEYAFLAIFLALTILGGLIVIGTGLNSGMSTISSSVSGAS